MVFVAASTGQRLGEGWLHQGAKRDRKGIPQGISGSDSQLLTEKEHNKWKH